MDIKVKRIIEAYLSNKKEGTNYVKPLLQDSDTTVPLHRDQEQSYTDLSQMDSTHGGPKTEQDLYDKMFVYKQDTEWTNPDWAGGDFQAPYENELQQQFNKTPNNYDTLFDPKRGGSVKLYIEDLNSRTSSIDNFLSEDTQFRTITAMDLTEFMKVSDETLIHKSTRDLWTMTKDADGNVFIHRKFNGEDILED